MGRYFVNKLHSWAITKVIPIVHWPKVKSVKGIRTCGNSSFSFDILLEMLRMLRQVVPLIKVGEMIRKPRG